MIEAVAPEVGRIALRTPTLPPATHTNCYVLGRRRLTVVDPASPWADAQDLLHEALGRVLSEGAVVERIVLTHHHVDHVSGAEALRRWLDARQSRRTPILAHGLTGSRAEGVSVDGVLHGGAVLSVDDRPWRLLHTPGHAVDHLVLHDAAEGTMVAGDMVAGVGTILIEPTEGDLGDYLASLEALRALAPRTLLPSHGPALPEGEAVLDGYLAHRHHRSRQVREALASADAPQGPEALVPRVYTDLDPRAHPVAAMQILAHLRWLVGRGEVQPHPDGGFTTP